MPANIKDHGGIEGDDSKSACETNVAAIDDASKAADDSTVYLPEGTWYFGGDDDRPLEPGAGNGRGAAGLGFTGDGPTKSFLVWGNLVDGSRNQIYYHEDATHTGATWDNITYGGRWRHFADNGYDFDAGGQWGLNLNGDGDLAFDNVRLRKMAGNGIFMGFGLNMQLSIDRCTFYDCGIGVDNATNGDNSSHLISHYVNDDNTPMEVTNSEFRLASGTAIDVNGDDTGNGTTTLENCYIEGIAVSMMKVNNPGKVVVKNVYFKGETQELVDELVQDSRANCFHRISGSDTYSPTVEFQDFEAVDCPGWGFRATDGKPVTLQGGTDGPVAMDNIGFYASSRDSALSGSDAELTFDQCGDLSCHNISGDVAALSSSDGSIDTLHWDNADSLGNDGGVTIGTENQGGSKFNPTVPSRSDVGINSSSSTSDSSPSTSWISPAEGDSLEGTVTVQIDASDSEDSDDSLTVEYRVHGNSWTSASYNTDTGYYEDTWDTTTVTDGDHTLEAQATDSAGNSSTASISVTVDNQTTFGDEWTPRWDSTSSDWDVVSGTEFEGEKALTFEGTTSDRHAISWDGVGEPSDIEILDKFRVKDSGLLARTQLRSSGTSGNESGYWLEVESREDAFRLGKYTDGDWATLKRFGTPQQNTFYYRRFRAEGEKLKAKVWQADKSEPSDWDIELTDGDHSKGWVGLGSYNAGATETDIMSVATGGETAPFVGSDNPPTVSWVTPTDSDSLEGTVTVQIDASDSEDSDDSLTVEYRIDGNSWTSASYNTDTGYYEDTWDTTTVTDGDHTLEAQATDSGDNSSTATITVTIDNASAPTVDSLSLSEVETDDSDAEFDIDWQVSDSDSDLASVDLVLTQDSDGSTEDSASVSVSGDSASSTTRLVAASDDGSGNSYTVELTVTDGGGNTASDTAAVTETEATSSAPTIDRFSVSEAGRPDPHAEITVVWDVSDADGDLASVDIDIVDSNGTVQSVTWTVSGTTASDTDSFRIKNGDGKTFDVAFTVRDANGKSTSETKSVTA